MKNNKNKKAFTLVELLLVVGAIALAGVGIYVAYNKAQETSFAEDEAKQLHNAIGRVQNALTTQTNFLSMNRDKLKVMGEYNPKLNLVSVFPESPNLLHFNYEGLTSGVCSKFISKMIVYKGDISAKSNGNTMKSGADPADIGVNCGANSNKVEIVVRMNNLESTLTTIVPTPKNPAITEPPPAPAPWVLPVAPSPSMVLPPVPAPYVPLAPVTATPGDTKIPVACLPGYNLVNGICMAPPPPLPPCIAGYHRETPTGDCIPPPPPPVQEFQCEGFNHTFGTPYTRDGNPPQTCVDVSYTCYLDPAKIMTGRFTRTDCN